MINWRAILGVTDDTTWDEVKVSYRKLAKKYHPDIYPKGKERDVAGKKMSLINEAYLMATNYFKKKDSSYSSEHKNKYEDITINIRKKREEANKKSQEETKRKNEDARKKKIEENIKKTITFTLNILYPLMVVEELNKYVDAIYDMLLTTDPISNISSEDAIRICFKTRFSYLDEKDENKYIDVLSKLLSLSKRQYNILINVYKNENNYLYMLRCEYYLKGKYSELEDSDLKLLIFLREIEQFLPNNDSLKKHNNVDNEYKAK